jgi:hypothetical protein
MDRPAGTESDRLRGLIEASDLDGLVRLIDDLVAAQRWDGLVRVRDGCLEAVDRGKQVWGAAQFAEYRMALDAPAHLAASVVLAGAGRFALGPLWEVAASSHTWTELEAHLADPAPRAFAAHERSIRGEALGAVDIDQRIVDIPLPLQAWEPRYPVAVYRADRADFPESDHPSLEWHELPGTSVRGERDEVVDALLELVRPWVDESSGRGEGVAVSGDFQDAIRALGPRRVRIGAISLEEALATMVWTGASGGAYGRRRGTPAGRSGAWWALASILGMEEPWPPDPIALGDEAGALRWWLWDPGDRVGGWNFHLAVEDPDEGLAWAVSAVDWV